MPEHASRVDAALYDQFEDEHRVADWGGDELFTRMPRPRAVDDAPAPRFRPYVASSASPERGSEPGAPGLRPPARAEREADAPPRAGHEADAPARERALSLVASPDRRAAEPDDAAGPRARRSAERAMRERARRLGLSVVEQPHEPATRDESTSHSDANSSPTTPVHRWDESGAMIEPEPAPRKTKVITGHPGGAPRPLPVMRAERRRPSRTTAEWVGARPERIVGWAFALGLLLILIAISTA
jgi:hypothetical protein